ncbi:MAG: peptidoglycan-binding protein [Hyphomicrobiales bacterium]
MTDEFYKPGDRYRDKDTGGGVSTDQLADAYLQLAAQVDHLSARLQKSEAKILSITRLESALSAHLSALNRKAEQESATTQLPPPPPVHAASPPAPDESYMAPPPSAVSPVSGERINLGHPDTMRHGAVEPDHGGENVYASEAPEPNPSIRAPRKRRKKERGNSTALVASLAILGLLVFLLTGGALAYYFGALDGKQQSSKAAVKSAPKKVAVSPPPPAIPPKKQQKALKKATEITREQALATPPTTPPLPAGAETTASIPSSQKPAKGTEEIPIGVFEKGLREDALSGDKRAQYKVARHFHEGKIVPQSDANAAVWIKKSAAQDYPPAVYRLAAMLERGRGVEKDLPRAFELYQQAAEEEHIVAMYNLSVFYISDKAGKRDYKKAAYWLQQSSQYGLRNAQFNLARFYQTGTGVERDLSQALYWYFLTARQGDKEAQNQINVISKQMESSEFESVLKRAQQWRPIPPNYDANGLQPPNAKKVTTSPTPQAQPPQSGFNVTPEIVRDVQSVLIATGYLTGSADGVAGPKTLEAVKTFQIDKGLPATGAIDQTFYDALKNQPG